MSYGTKELMASVGMDYNVVHEYTKLMERAIMDGVSPGICTVCGYTTEVEPDQDRGWCEVCKKNTVRSLLVLEGVI